MKKIFLFMLLCVASVAKAQKYTARRTVQTHDVILNDTLQQNAIYRAGTFLKKSAEFQYASIGSACVSSALLALGYERDKKGLKIAGYAFAGTTILAQLLYYDYQWKSGRELQIGAGQIVFKF